MSKLPVDYEADMDLSYASPRCPLPADASVRRVRKNTEKSERRAERILRRQASTAAVRRVKNKFHLPTLGKKHKEENANA